MVETPAEPGRKPQRFPYVAALLCAGCLGAAVWTWMRYSYAWDVTPSGLGSLAAESGPGRWPQDHGKWPEDIYVRVSGRIVGPSKYGPHTVTLMDCGNGRDPVDAHAHEHQGRRQDSRGQLLQDMIPGRGLFLAIPAVECSFAKKNPAWRTGDKLSAHGRFVGLYSTVDGRFGWRIHAMSSRFTGASIAGLVVGAMGVFVFSVALRHWLNQRRAAA